MEEQNTYISREHLNLYSSPRYDHKGNAGLPNINSNKKAVMFVDANNWYHNVKRIFNPSSIDICLVRDLISKRFNLNIIEIKWYASIPSIADGKSLYYKHLFFLDSLKKKGIKLITRKLQRLSNKEVIEKQKNTLNKLDLCIKCKPLVESAFLDLSILKKKEKGIDTWIAVDMIKESVIDKRCDVCLLISGDADFVPALDLIKKQGKNVLTAMVPKGYSSELRTKFPFFILNNHDLIKCMYTK